MKTAMAVLTCVVASLVAGGALAQSALPDPSQTPGMINAAVTPATIGTTICVRGWTRTVRPPVEFTEELKRRQIGTGGWGADRKDELEWVLNRLVCAGRLPLHEAQRAIATDWIAAYRRYVGSAADPD
jgi:hypothetical protein